MAASFASGGRFALSCLSAPFFLSCLFGPARGAASHARDRRNGREAGPAGPGSIPAIPAKICHRTDRRAVSTTNISLAESLQSFVDEQVEKRAFGTRSESVRELIRKDQEHLQLRGLLLEAAAPAQRKPAGPVYVRTLRERIRAAGKRQASARK